MALLFRWRGLLLAPLMVLVVGCPDDVEYVPIDGDDTGADAQGDGADDTGGGDATVPPGCEFVPVIQVNSPQEGVTYSHTEPLLMAVEVTHFAIVDRLSQANGDCEGHFHVFIDDIYQGATPLLERTYDIESFGTGPRTFKISIHNNDHSPYPGIEPIVIEFDTE